MSLGSQVVAIVNEALGNSSYIVDLGDGRALVVDPTRDPEPYLQQAKTLGLKVAFTLETHLHADFISGSRELMSRGAEVIAPKSGELALAHRGIADGEEIELGDLLVRAISTPGHTPEHLSYLVSRGNKPVALFSGGALIPGSVARTDLIAPDQTESLARALYASLKNKIMSLPDAVTVYPTHGGGSFCSVSGATERTTTIGQERELNPLLQVANADEFVEQLLRGLGTYPPYFLKLRPINRQGPSLLSEARPLEAFTPAEILKRQEAGAAIVDVRMISDWAAGHVPGSISIEMRDSFATWLGWLVEFDQPIVFVMDQDQNREEVVSAARSIGYERLIGELAGGMEAWQAASLPVQETQLGPGDDADVVRLDVRQRSEFDSGHIPGALNAELGSLAQGLPELPSGPIFVHCEHGQRATSAASLLERAGRQDVRVLTTGPKEWSELTGNALKILD